MALSSNSELPMIARHPADPGNSSNTVTKDSSTYGSLEDEIAAMRTEIETLKIEIVVLKRALRTKIARYEISLIKQGTDVRSIIE